MTTLRTAMKRAGRRLDPEARGRVDDLRKKGYISPSEASAVSKTPLATIYTWIRTGTIEHERIGRRLIFVSVESLRALVGPLMTEPGAKRVA